MKIKYRKNDEWRIHTFLIEYDKLYDLDSVIRNELSELSIESNTYSTIDIIDTQLLLTHDNSGTYRVTVYFALSNDK